MKTQFDYTKRVVSVENLEAMCKRITGVCHRFEVSKVTRSRVHVTYSNPDEYAVDSPMTAVFPSYPSGNDTLNFQSSPSVVLDILRVIGDNWNGEGWQAFEELLACPPLYRCGNHELEHAWYTEEEIKRNEHLN